ncbi:MAG TPA: hypothetical protein VGM67_15255 [Gemmatimonadaceae bacterium]|jgi:hypothetical protein
MVTRHAIVARLAVGAVMTLTAAATAMTASAQASAQTTAHAPVTTDLRWTPWLGCWQSDTVGTGASGISVPTQCVVPVAGSSSVEQLSIVDGQVVSRRSLIANGKPNPMEEGGCHGDETANWSPTSRRIYLHATYSCAAGLQGTSSSVFAIAPNGDWLEVQNVRAGGGSLDRVLRWHDAPSPRGLAKASATQLAAQRLAIATARAGVARPLTTDDVIEATRAVDPSTVQSWLVATGQQFSLDATQIAALGRADVPASIVQLMAGVAPSTAAEDESERQRVDDYLRGYATPDDAYGSYGASTVLPVNPYSGYNGYNGYGTYVPYTPYPAYGYPTYGYDGYGYGSGYPAPIVVVHGETHGETRGGLHGVGRGRPIDGGHPSPPGPIGRPPVMHAPAGRPIGAVPPVSRPPVAHMTPAAQAPPSRQPAAAAPSPRQAVIAAPSRTRP